MRATWMIGLAVLAGVAGAAFGQDDPRIDDGGRQAALWPPDRPFDHQHMRLAVTIPDMEKPELSGELTLTARAVGVARRIVPLDCRGPQITGITADGEPATFSADDGKLVVTLPTPIPAGQDVTLVIRYTCDFSKNQSEGLVYQKGRSSAHNESDKLPQIWSQGEAQSNSRWFPCHDSPNEKLTSELVVSVPEGYTVCSNGRLVSSTPGADGLVTWDWVQDKPHSAYLVTMAVGKFSIVDLADEKWGRPGTPVVAYVPVGQEEAAKNSLAGTPEMIRFYEQRFDEPYPWDKYAQVFVRRFNGGMENTSATTMMDQLLDMGEGRADSIVSHELAHQWFGDLVTCNSWEHLWLNEGWATYVEALWAEHKADLEGKGRAKTAYQRAIRGNLRGARGGNRSNPADPAMASNRILNPEEMFARPDNPYSKGGCILHMLRTRLGDDAFFKGAALYLDRYKFQTARSDDFRRALEEASGVSLERFFDERVYRPGMPAVALDLDWDDAGKALNVTLDQTQKIDRLNPAYALEVPLVIKFPDESVKTVIVVTDAKEKTARIPLPARPDQVVVDPDMAECLRSNVRKPLAMWINELRDGPTWYARVQAAEALSLIDAREARDALFAAAIDHAQDDGLRREAARGVALGTMRSAARYAAATTLRFFGVEHPASTRVAAAPGTSH